MGLLTGHCSVRYQLKKMGLVEQDTCQFCFNWKELTEHLLCDGKKFAHQRFSEFSWASVGPEDIRDTDPMVLIGFISIWYKFKSGQLPQQIQKDCIEEELVLAPLTPLPSKNNV